MPGGLSHAERRDNYSKSKPEVWMAHITPNG
jgi:hypothetical protein